MHKQRHWFVLSAAALLASTLWAAEPAAPPAQAGSPKPEAAKSEAAKPQAAKTDAAASATAGESAQADAAKSDTAKQDTKTVLDAAKAEKDKAAAAEKGSPQLFIPSEQVRADFDVSFPIDI
jgi:hypothetical protein